jgi:hypothetical protein
MRAKYSSITDEEVGYVKRKNRTNESFLRGTLDYNI